MDPISDYRVEELSEEQMAKAVEVAHRAGKKVMAHAEGAEGIKAAVRAGVDSIEHGTVMDEEGARLMEQRGTWLVPTLFCFQHDLQTGTLAGPRSGQFCKRGGNRKGTGAGLPSSIGAPFENRLRRR